MKLKDVNVKNEAQVLRNIINNSVILTIKPPKFKINDFVRIIKYKEVFKKGYEQNFTNEIFTVVDVKNTRPTMYILQDYHGQLIKGAFFEEEMTKVNLHTTR